MLTPTWISLLPRQYSHLCLSIGVPVGWCALSVSVSVGCCACRSLRLSINVDRKETGTKKSRGEKTKSDGRRVWKWEPTFVEKLELHWIWKYARTRLSLIYTKRIRFNNRRWFRVFLQRSYKTKHTKAVCINACGKLCVHNSFCSIALYSPYACICSRGYKRFHSLIHCFMYSLVFHPISHRMMCIPWFGTPIICSWT